MKLWYYLPVINVVLFLLFGWDKHQAVHDGWRVSEKTQLVLALLGGSIGAMTGMRLFHHKTRKALFRYGIPLMLVAELAGYAYLRFVR